MTDTNPQMQAEPATSNFRTAVQKISPPWLQALNGYKVTYSAIGIIFDCLAEYIRLGALQQFPELCQSDALPFIGSDLKILRGFREADAAYAGRLIHALATWRLAGNAPTLLAELAAYFSPNAPVLRYVVNGTESDGSQFVDWWTLENGNLTHSRYFAIASPFGSSNWNWDGQTDQIRFWIIIYRNEGFTPWFWGDGHFWGGGQSWGFEETFTENFAVDARNIIAQWKAAGSHCLQLGGLIVTGDLSLFSPTTDDSQHPHGDWATYANRAGIPTTFYLDGI